MAPNHRLVRIIVVVVIAAISVLPAVLASQPVIAQQNDMTNALYRTWERTDKPVVDAAVARSWVWGPESFSGVRLEPYGDTPGDTRYVQYYDKSRMEVNDPAADPASDWYVTNGLLATELITGRLQLGDAIFEARDPARVNVAGDPDDPFGITYAHLAGLLTEPPLDEGEEVSTYIKVTPPHEPSGVIQFDDYAHGHGVTAAVLAPETNHRVASVFWEFMTSTGPIVVDGQYVEGPLFSDPYYPTGFPIAEAYWIRAKVGGVFRDVLFQCFQRRCLTYTPDNPEDWRVEAGNVGQHYHRWRYAHENPIAFTAGHEIYVVQPDGTGLLNRTEHPAYDWGPLWSPDGSRLLFMSDRDVTPGMPISDVCCSGELYLMHAGGGDPVRLTSFLPDLIERWTWSSDGTRIAVAVWRGDHGEIWIVNADGSGMPRMLIGDGYQPSWSPDGSQIAFVSDHDGNPEVFVINVESRTDTQLTFTSEVVGGSDPRWSPDGMRIAFQTNRDDDYEIYLMNANGSDQRNLTQAASYDEHHSWSPDGATIIFASQRDDQVGVYGITIDSSTTVDLTPDTSLDHGPVLVSRRSPDRLRLLARRRGRDLRDER